MSEHIDRLVALCLTGKDLDALDRASKLAERTLDSYLIQAVREGARRVHAALQETTDRIKALPMGRRELKLAPGESTKWMLYVGRHEIKAVGDKVTMHLEDRPHPVVLVSTLTVYLKVEEPPERTKLGPGQEWYTGCRFENHSEEDPATIIITHHRKLIKGSGQ